MDYKEIFEKASKKRLNNNLPNTEQNNSVSGDPVDYKKIFDNPTGISRMLGSDHQTFSRDYTNRLRNQTYKFDLYEGQNWDFIRANNQKFLDKLANTVISGIGSGGITALEGFSNVFDQISNLVTGTEQFEKSAITNLLGEGKQGLLEALPIYRKNPEKVFDWSDSGFYFEFMRGVIDSAIGFGIPGMAYAGVVGKLGSVLGRAELMGRRLSVLTRIHGGANFAQNLGMLGATALSNFNEGTVLALEVYDQEYERSREALVNSVLSEKQLDSENKLSSEEINSIENRARQNANKAAHNTRNLNMLMMGSNYFQLRGTLNLKNAIVGGQTSTRNLIGKPSVKNFWKDQAIGAPIEAIEEIAQNVFQRESEYKAQKRLEGLGINLSDDQKTSLEDNIGKRLIEFATSDEALLEGMMGLVSGPFQYAITRAPFNKAEREAKHKRFASQQAIIGANEEFIRKELSQGLKAEDLASRFQEFRDKFQKAENTSEEQLTEEFFKLIENASFDILASKNFFTGTTENLEKQLQSVGEDPNATQEEKESAQNLLTRLGELEQRFTSFNRYEDGARMFAKTLRIERLNEIEKNLQGSFPQLEAAATRLINAKLDSLTEAGFNMGSMEDHFWLTEGENKFPLRSVQELVTAVQNGEDVRMSKLMSDNNIFDSDSITNFIINRENLKSLNKVRNRIEISLDEDKSLDGQDLFTRFNTILNDTGTEIKDKIEGFENLKKDKRFRKGKFDDLKRVIDEEIIKHQRVEKAINEETDQETKDKIEETKTKSKEEKTAKKTTPQPQQDKDTEPVTISKEDLFDTFDPGDLSVDPTQVSEQVSETKPQEVEIQVGKNKRVYFVDPDGTVRNKNGAIINQQSIIDKVNEKLNPQVEEVTETQTIDTEVQNVPQTQVENKDNVKDINDPEILPTREEEKGHAQTIIKKESEKIVKVIESSTVKEGGEIVKDPSVKLMTLHGSGDQAFKEWLKNGKSKKGDTMVLSVDLNPGEKHFNNVNVNKAIQLVKDLRDNKRSLTEDDKEFIHKWIPVRISHSEDSSVFTYMYNFNPKAGKDQKESEIILKKAALNSFIKGRSATVKIKDQSPGELVFDDQERMLSELPNSLDNPQDIGLFYTVAGTVQPVSGTRNPFVDTVMTYQNADGTKDSWEGVLIMEVKTLSGHSFPLKLNVRKHTVESATLVYDLYNDILGGKNLNNQLKTENPALYERVTEMLPSLLTAYPNPTYTQVINDLVYQSDMEGYSRLNFSKGNLFVGDKVYNRTEFTNNRDKIINTIAERKGFNVSVKRLASSNDYRRHAFSSYLSTNADVNNMFDISGRLNPTGDKHERLLSGAVWVDSTTTELSAKTEQPESTVSFEEAFKSSVINEAKEIVKDNLEKEGKEVSEKPVQKDSVKISYTPKGKTKQEYTIVGSKIFNKQGQEVFKEDSVDRNKIFANLRVKEGKASIIEHKGKKYIVNDKNQIISAQTGNIMKWAENNGDRIAILNKVSKKDKTQPKPSIIETMTQNKKQVEELEEKTDPCKKNQKFSGKFKGGL